MNLSLIRSMTRSAVFELENGCAIVRPTRSPLP